MSALLQMRALADEHGISAAVQALGHLLKERGEVGGIG